MNEIQITRMRQISCDDLAYESIKGVDYAMLLSVCFSPPIKRGRQEMIMLKGQKKKSKY